MNILKNMEAIFLATLALAGATSYASAAIPAMHVQHGTRVSVEQTSVDGRQIEVITVTATRLSAADKARL
jgi:hypothetical protein